MTHDSLVALAAPEGGFTLIELIVVVLVVGVLAATAAPQYARVMERGRANEAILALDVVKASEDRYYNKYGAYCIGPATSCGLDIALPNLKNFNAWGNLTAGTGNPSWKTTVTRNANTAFYGAYTLTLDVEPNAAPALTCSVAQCTNDLLPTIH